MKISGRLFLVLLMTSQLVFAETNSCLLLFNPKAPYFKFEDKSQQLSKLNKKDQVFLGRGYSSSVSIVWHPLHPEKKVVKKIYQQDSFGTDRYHFDAEAMTELKQILSQYRAETFRLVDFERTMERIEGYSMPQMTARTDYVPGRNAHDLLMDPHVSSTTKKIVRENFVRLMQNLKQVLSHDDLGVTKLTQVDPEPRFFYDEKIDKVPMLKGQLKKGGAIIIKTDNVIVNPDDLSVMTLVDPY